MIKANSRGRPHSVRIIGGRWRGRRLAVAPSAGLRPTPDRVRETLFNWLAGVIQGGTCLDLYAGTGVLGLEALSRGAAHTTFVDRDKAVMRTLERAARELGASCAIEHSTAEAFIGRSVALFDVVFLDPPYETDPLSICATVLAERLQPGGLVYVERPSANGLTAFETVGRLIKRSRAGGVHFGLLAPQTGP